MQRIRKKDTVVVVSGKDKGKRGIVLDVDVQNGLVRVQGIAIVHRHMKARRQGESPQIKKTESYIPLAKVMLFDAKTGRPCRVNYLIGADNEKLRISNLSKEVI